MPKCKRGAVFLAGNEGRGETFWSVEIPQIEVFQLIKEGIYCLDLVGGAKNIDVGDFTCLDVKRDAVFFFEAEKDRTAIGSGQSRGIFARCDIEIVRETGA